MFYHVLEGCQSGTLVQCDELDYRKVHIEQEKDIDYVVLAQCVAIQIITNSDVVQTTHSRVGSAAHKKRLCESM